MLRSTIRWSLLFLVAAACLIGTAAGPTAAEKKAQGKKALIKAAAKEKQTAPSLEKLLATRIDLDNGFEKNTPLKVALEFLSSEHKVPIVIDSQAFAAINIAQVDDMPVHLPKMKGVRLGTVINMLARQIPGESGHGGAFLIRPDFVEITTTNAVAVEVWGQHFTGPYLPLVHVRFERRPLEQVIKELAESTSINVVLDQRAKDQAQTEVTARFVNTPLDTAVRFLADMAELQAVLLDNVIYVTSPQNAAVLQEALQKEGQIREGEGPRPRVGSVGIGSRGAAAPVAGGGFGAAAAALGSDTAPTTAPASKTNAKALQEVLGKLKAK